MTGDSTHEVGGAPRRLDDPDIAILRGDPSPPEIAAIVAVLTEVAREAAEADASAAKARSGAWERSTRRLREPLDPGPGAWRGFAR